MPRLVIAFDGSPSARAAVERAARLLPGAEAVVASVAAGLEELGDAASMGRLGLSDAVLADAVTRLRDSARTDTEQLAREGAELAAGAGLDARALVLAGGGPVWSQLAEAARRAGAHAIACGTHGHGAAARAVLGSASSALVQHAGLPVLVVGDDSASGRGPALLAYDDSEPATRAIGAAGALLGGGKAVVVRVWRSQIRHTLSGRALGHAPLEELRETVEALDAQFATWAREDAERGVAHAREHGFAPRAQPVESGEPAAAAILDAARELDASVVVVGRRGRGPIASALLGSVSQSVLHAADRPVLVA